MIMNKLIIALLLEILLFSGMYSDSAELVSMDNSEIQQYNGVIGRWVSVSNYSKLKEFIREFGSDEDKVKSINHDFKYNSFVFIPFSEEYKSSLQKKGIFRKECILKQDEFLWPLLTVSRISSLIGQRWGSFHPGVDLAVPNGTPIVATLDGKVISSKYLGGYGNCVILEHRKGFITKYGHNSYLFVKEGDYVKKGQILALSGNTGRSTGPHLHFEVRFNDIPLDPLDFLPDDDSMNEAMDRIKNYRR